MDEEGPESNDPTLPTVNTYHCLCSALILASTHSLSSLATRAPPAQDQALILPLPSPSDRASNPHAHDRTGGRSNLLNTTEDRRPTVVRREDGFEKRTLIRCARCNLPVAYRLDESQFTDPDVKANEVVYILPGGLASTVEMKAGRVPDVPEWAVEVS